MAVLLEQAPVSSRNDGFSNDLEFVLVGTDFVEHDDTRPIPVFQLLNHQPRGIVRIHCHRQLTPRSRDVSFSQCDNLGVIDTKEFSNCIHRKLNLLASEASLAGHDFENEIAGRNT